MWPRLRSWSESTGTGLELTRNGQVPSDMSSPIASIHRTFQEAQKNCDSIVLNAKEHPRLKAAQSELGRIEATIKTRATESFESFKRFSESGSSENFLKPLSPLPLPPPILGIRRVVSENSIQSPVASGPKDSSLEHPPFGHRSTVPDLMTTMQRTMLSAQKAAETHAAALLTSSGMLRGSSFLPKGGEMAGTLDDSSSHMDFPGNIRVEQMMAKPLGALQKIQQVAEASYRETHAQVYQLMAPSIKTVGLQGGSKFTAGVATGTLTAPRALSDEWEKEAKQVIVSLSGCKQVGDSNQASQVGLEVDPGTVPSTSGTGKEDLSTLAEWKKWLQKFELREAQDSADQLAGEIDTLGGNARGTHGHDSPESPKSGSPWKRVMDMSLSMGSWPGLENWLLRKQKQGSNLRDEGRSVAIVTTAALPWMTGTAVNPLLRAVYLAKDDTRNVTLVIPWLTISDQTTIFPNITFDSPDRQEEYVREWARKRTGMDTPFKVQFYPARYAPEKGSILPVGDLTQYIPDNEADVAVLEEPEHLNWYHHGRCWTDKFNHVVGIVHTNYLDYARREEGGEMKENVLKVINSWVCQAHCHKVVKLSGAVQPLPKEHTEFVHGVSPSFLEVGMNRRTPKPGTDKRFSDGFYFIGKVVWAKGYTELLQMVKQHKDSCGEDIPVDVYGGGPDLPDVQTRSASLSLPLKFHGPKDHLSPEIHDYKVLVNPSTSDVVATTSAEALAMGKFVICCEHPSNRFFSQFSNCLVYRTPEEFSQKVKYAREHEPKPLSDEEKYKLTWEAATERFLDIASLSPAERDPGPLGKAVDSLAYFTHNAFSGFEPLRVTAGAHPGTRDNPETVTSYVPSPAPSGGLFDRKP